MVPLINSNKISVHSTENSAYQYRPLKLCLSDSWYQFKSTYFTSTLKYLYYTTFNVKEDNY